MLVDSIRSVKPSSSSTFRIHCGLFLAEILCVPAFLFELSRAQSGNTLSWAYVFEWPILGGYAVYMWAKMLKEERGDDARSRSRRAHIDVDATADPELDAWNAYLAKVHGTEVQGDVENRED